MSLNSYLYTLTDNQYKNKFYGDTEVKHTFYHTHFFPKVIICLNLDGTLKKAYKAQADTIIVNPCTLESLSKGQAHYYAYALHNKAKYLSKLLSDSDLLWQAVDGYMENLWDWYSYKKNRKIRAVFKYLENKNIVADLSRRRIHIDGETEIAFTFWNNDRELFPWQDEKLIDQYIEYYERKLSKTENGGICYTTGLVGRQSYKFPKGFAPMGPFAKYTSGEDKRGINYGGVFDHAYEAVGINDRTVYYHYWAINFILRKYSYAIGDKRYAFVPLNNEYVPKPYNSFHTIANHFDCEDWKFEDYDLIKESIINGLSDDTIFLYIGFSARSQGRLEIATYQEYHKSEIYKVVENIIDFHKRSGIYMPIEFMELNNEYTSELDGNRKYIRKKRINKLAGSLTIQEYVDLINNMECDGKIKEHKSPLDQDVYNELIYNMLEGQRFSIYTIQQIREIPYSISPYKIKRLDFVNRLRQWVSLYNLVCGMSVETIMDYQQNQHLGILMGFADLIEFQVRKGNEPTVLQRSISFKQYPDLETICTTVKNNIELIGREDIKEHYKTKLISLSSNVKTQENENQSDHIGIIYGYVYGLLREKEELWRLFKKSIRL